MFYEKTSIPKKKHFADPTKIVFQYTVRIYIYIPVNFEPQIKTYSLVNKFFESNEINNQKLITYPLRAFQYWTSHFQLQFAWSLSPVDWSSMVVGCHTRPPENYILTFIYCNNSLRLFQSQPKNTNLTECLAKVVGQKCIENGIDAGIGVGHHMGYDLDDDRQVTSAVQIKSLQNQDDLDRRGQK